MFIELHTNKNSEWIGLVVSLFLLIFSLFIMWSLGPAGIVLGFFSFLMGFGMTIMASRKFFSKKSAFEIHEDFFLYRKAVDSNFREFVDHNFKYSDITSISQEGLFDNYSDVITISFQNSFSKNYGNEGEIKVDTGMFNFDKMKLIQILEMKRSDSSVTLSEILNKIEYVPNEMPPHMRFFYFFGSLSIMIHTGYGAFTGRLIMPAKRGNYLVLTDASLWICSISLLCFVAYLFSAIIDHYDKRDNEGKYRKYRSVLFRSGFSLYLIALLVNVFFG